MKYIDWLYKSYLGYLSNITQDHAMAVIPPKARPQAEYKTFSKIASVSDISFIQQFKKQEGNIVQFTF